MKVLLAAALAWAGLSAFAYADPRDDQIVEQVAVPYGDLDLDSDSGARTMLRRMERGARKACGGWPGRAPLEIIMAYRDCFETALSDAVASLDRPMVSAFYEMRWGREPVGYASAAPRY